MTVQVTVGDINPESPSNGTRGTVAARLVPHQQPDEHQVMIEVIATFDALDCAVQLTISEAEVLYNVLDSLIFEAAIRSPKIQDRP